MKTHLSLDDELASMYGNGLLLGRRISRFEEQDLGPFEICTETMKWLGLESIGVLVGGFADMRCMVEFLRPLDDQPLGGTWVVVAADELLTNEIARIWRYGEDSWMRQEVEAPPFKLSNNVVLATPETMTQVTSRLKRKGVRVLGILVVDPDFSMHRPTAGWRSSMQIQEDQPQQLVKFRAQFAIGPWQPPLFVLGTPRAKAISADGMLGPYCLEAFQFVDGSQLSTPTKVSTAI